MAGFVAVHTGAGNCVDETRYEKPCRTACERATAVMKAGGNVLQACEAAIVVLENSANTNAGYGSNLTWDGTVECEASIMDGTSLLFGACTNVSDIANPISLAKILCEKQNKLLVMGRIPPMVLSGRGASDYARSQNLPLISSDSLLTRKSVRFYKHYMGQVASLQDADSDSDQQAEWEEGDINGDGSGEDDSIGADRLDTVGAVCVDAAGNCAAGCSSGGLWLKLSGRVGQAATYGAGCWATTSATRSAATCTTGNGEYLMRTLLARQIVDDLVGSQCAVTAQNSTFKEKFLRSPFLAGLQEAHGGALSLVYDASTGHGEVLWSHTTRALCLAYQSTTSQFPRFVYSTLPAKTQPGTTVSVTGHPFRLPI